MSELQLLQELRQLQELRLRLRLRELQHILPNSSGFGLKADLNVTEIDNEMNKQMEICYEL